MEISHVRNRWVYALPDMCIWIYWGFQMIMKGLAFDSSDELFKIGTYVIIPVAIIKIIQAKYTAQELVKYGLITGLAVIAYLSSKNEYFFIIVFTILLAKDIHKSRLWKMGYRLRGGAYFVQVCLALLGILEIGNMMTGDRNRYSFGYSHANLAHGELFMIISYYVLAKEGNLKKHDYFLIVFIDLLIYQFTQSRTGLICILLLLLFNYLKVSIIYRTFMEKIGKYCFILFSLLCLVLSSFYYVLPWIQNLDTFSSRFLTAWWLQHQQRLTLFGKNIGYTSDLGYMNALYNYGIVFFSVFVLGHTFLIMKFIKEKRWYLAGYFLVISVYYILEGYQNSVLYNAGWLYYTELLGNNKNKYPA